MQISVYTNSVGGPNVSVAGDENDTPEAVAQAYKRIFINFPRPHGRGIKCS